MMSKQDTQMENIEDGEAFKRMASAISDDSANDVSAKMFKQGTDDNNFDRGVSFNSQVSGVMEKG